jgi:hypothetical protein
MHFWEEWNGVYCSTQEARIKADIECVEVIRMEKREPVVVFGALQSVVAEVGYAQCLRRGYDSFSRGNGPPIDVKLGQDRQAA